VPGGKFTELAEEGSLFSLLEEKNLPNDLLYYFPVDSTFLSNTHKLL